MRNHDLVTENGVKILRSMSREIFAASEDNDNALKYIRSIIDDKQEFIGPYYDELISAFEEIHSISNKSHSDIEIISGKIDGLADRYQELIDEAPFD